MVLFPGGAFGERKYRDRDTRARCGQKSKGGGEREEPTERERERERHHPGNHNPYGCIGLARWGR